MSCNDFDDGDYKDDGNDYDAREVAWALVTWSKEGLDEVARYGEARFS